MDSKPESTTPGMCAGLQYQEDIHISDKLYNEVPLVDTHECIPMASTPALH